MKGRYTVENITPEQIMKILQEHGTEVTLEEAKAILEFMWKLANMALDQYLKL